MTGLVSVALVVLGIGLMVALMRSSRSSKASPPPPRVPVAPAAVEEGLTARIAVGSVDVPEARPAFAQPGGSGRLFSYGGDCAGYLLDAPFAVVDIETTGFSPAGGDRIIEIAIARVDAEGRIHDEYTTLLDPGRDVGPVFLHGISNIDVRDAPRFAEIAGDLLDRLDGAVVVAHNAAFADRFLAAEFERAGVFLPVMPALCSLWLAQETVSTPNHTLASLARYAGLTSADAHSALGDVRALAALLPELLDRFGRPLQYPTPPTELPVLEGPEGGARLRAREPEVRKGGSDWMAALTARLPLAATDARDADVQRYLDGLSVALAEGRMVGHEAPEVARLAASAGLAAVEVHGLHRRFLEAMKREAVADAILTTAELRQLRTTAALLGLPDFFAELRPTSPQDLLAAGRGPAPRVL